MKKFDEEFNEYLVDKRVWNELRELGYSRHEMVSLIKHAYI